MTTSPAPLATGARGESLGARMRAALYRFVEPGLDLPLALLRVGLGLALVFTYAQLVLDYDLYFSRWGLVPASEWPGLRPELTISYFRWVSDYGAQKAIAYAGLLPACAFVLGLFPRVSALLAWYCLISLQDRSPILLDGGDLILRLMLFFFIFAKSDRRLSPLAPLLPRDPAGSFPIRLMQLQLATVYLCTGLEKFRGAKWQNGTALAYVLRLDSFSRADWARLSSMPVFVNLITYGTLLWEIAFIFLVWQRKSRPWILATGVAMHLGIELLMYVPMFSWVMMTSYFCFFLPEWGETLVSWVTRPLVERARARGIRAAAPAKLLPGLRALDVWSAVAWEAAPAASGESLVVWRGATRADGTGAYFALAPAVPSFLVLAPLAALPGGQGLLARLLARSEGAATGPAPALARSS